MFLSLLWETPEQVWREYRFLNAVALEIETKATVFKKYKTYKIPPE